MALGEFELIARYFSAAGAQREDVLLGVGDDGALLAPPPGEALVAVLDTLVEGTHFLPGTPARSVGHRALAVNLSDIAAMGATPRWALLALTLPRVDEAWLAEFAVGFAALARRHAVALVGGDTTRGPLALSVQVLGTAPAGAALRRDGARPGDLLCVTGTPGDAAAGLGIERGLAGGAAPSPNDARAALLARFHFPTPRLAWGLRLRGIASACIDVSDGLAADAGKLAAASGCGVEIDATKLPLSRALRVHAAAAQAVRFALSGGDDYELCFTLPPHRLEALRAAWPPESSSGPEWTVIGTVTAGQGVTLHGADSVTQVSQSGYDHFAG